MSAHDTLAVADSTDWLSTPLAAISPIESALRCQVCKDFYKTPMMTSCSHTFCSLCIRRYLSAEGKCPVCREPDQEIKLRRNWTVEELVSNFTPARAGILDFARRTSQLATDDVENGRPQKRRKIADSKSETQSTAVERRSTRSQSRRTAVGAVDEAGTPKVDEVADSEDGSIYEVSPGPAGKLSNQEPHDGLVACPCCGRRMKEAIINSHLDRCINGEATPPPVTSSSPTPPQRQFSPVKIVYTQTKPSKQLERLPTLNYSVMNENSLRKKLKELGIPTHGSKELMRKRHTEWVNLWNANCDSRDPVSKQKLLSDLDIWERTLGRNPDRGPSGVMVKEFDRNGYAKSNKNNFDDLIAQARAKRKVVTNDPDERHVTDSTDASSEDRASDSVKPGSIQEAEPSVNGTGNNATTAEDHLNRLQINGHAHSDEDMNVYEPNLPRKSSQEQRLENNQNDGTNSTPRRKQPMFI